MALSNYDELVKSVIKWSHREDLLLLIPDFILLAEEAMYNSEVQPLKLRSMEYTSTTSTTGKVIALPDDFESSRSTRLTIDGGEIQYVTPEALKTRSGTGRPCFFTIIGNTIEFDITPDQAYVLQLQYFRKIPALTTDNQTNAILTEHPAIYLNGTILEAMIYAQDYEQAQLYRQRFYNAIKGANKVDKQGRYGNAPTIRIEGGFRP